MKVFSNQSGVGLVVVIIVTVIVLGAGVGGYALLQSSNEESQPAIEHDSKSESHPDSDEDKVQQVVLDYYQALGAKDYKTACEQLSTAAQAEAGRLFNTGSCEASLERSLSTTSAADLAKLQAAKISSVQVQGTTATVQVEAATKPIAMERVGSDWKIASYNN
jgi:predicted negative regulator of RcsB-dependent stress response